MTSLMRQDATGSERGMGAGILKGKHQAYGTTIYASRRVHFGANEKDDGAADSLQLWQDLCKPTLDGTTRDSLTDMLQCHGSVTTSSYSLATGTAHVLDYDSLTDQYGSRETFSYFCSLRSAFRVHNETVNIWSHILAAITFICVLSLLHLSPSRQKTNESDNSTTDAVAIFTYLLSVIVCFVFSFMQVQIFYTPSPARGLEKIRALTIAQPPHLPRPRRKRPQTNMPLRLPRHCDPSLRYHSLKHPFRLPL